MRASGWVESAAGLFPDGHLCWAFRDRDDFVQRAGDYVAEALDGGYWVEYVGQGSPSDLRTELGEVDGLAEAAAAGRAGVCSVEQFYRFAGAGVVDPEASVAARVAAVQEVVADGFAGFRAVVDCTAVASTPQQREAFGRFEYLIDQKMSMLPVSAMCSYDASVLGPDGVAQMACLHPLANPDTTSFRLHSAADYAFAIGGDIDFGCAELFGRTLAQVAETLPTGAETVVDGRGLEFVDHRGLRALSDLADRLEGTVVLRTRLAVTAKLAAMLPTPNLRVEVTA